MACPDRSFGKVVQAGQIVSVSEIKSITTYGVKIFNNVYAVGTVPSTTSEETVFFYRLGAPGCVYRAPWQEQLGTCDRPDTH